MGNAISTKRFLIILMEHPPDEYIKHLCNSIFIPMTFKWKKYWIVVVVFRRNAIECNHRSHSHPRIFSDVPFFLSLRCLSNWGWTKLSFGLTLRIEGLRSLWASLDPGGPPATQMSEFNGKSFTYTFIEWKWRSGELYKWLYVWLLWKKGWHELPFPHHAESQDATPPHWICAVPKIILKNVPNIFFIHEGSTICPKMVCH